MFSIPAFAVTIGKTALSVSVVVGLFKFNVSEIIAHAIKDAISGGISFMLNPFASDFCKYPCFHRRKPRTTLHWEIHYSLKSF